MSINNLAVVPIITLEGILREIVKEELKALSDRINVKKEEQLLTRTQLAEALDVTPTTITNYTNEGLPCKSIKKRKYYYLTAALDWKESTKNKRR